MSYRYRKEEVNVVKQEVAAAAVCGLTATLHEHYRLIVGGAAFSL